MKTLITIITLASITAHANCTLTIKVKKPTAKTAYLGHSKLSKKTIEKLKPHCTIKRVVMSKSELKALKIQELQSKLAKLQGGK